MLLSVESTLSSSGSSVICGWSVAWNELIEDERDRGTCPNLDPAARRATFSMELPGVRGGSSWSEEERESEDAVRFLGKIGSPYATLRHCSEEVGFESELEVDEFAEGSGGETSEDVDGPSYFLTTIHSWISETIMVAVTRR